MMDSAIELLRKSIDRNKAVIFNRRDSLKEISYKVKDIQEDIDTAKDHIESCELAVSKLVKDDEET